MGNKQKVKLHVMAAKYRFSDKYTYLVREANCENATDENTHVKLLSTVEIEIDAPDINEKQLVLDRVDQLKGVIKKERAESFARVTAIEEKIQSLLCIEAK